MKALAALWVLLALTGCSALPVAPLHSAWYLQYADAKAGASQNLFIALLNRSGRTLEVEEVVVNRSGADDTPAWRWTPSNIPYRLDPGRLVTLPADRFKRNDGARLSSTECVLPVDVSVVVSPASRKWIEEWIMHVPGDPRGAIRADLVGRMPSSLPEGWDVQCAPEGVPPPAASPPR